MKLDDFFTKLFTRQNVRRQLSDLFVLTILVPTVVAGSLIFSLFSRQLTRKYEHLSESEANRTRSVLVTTTFYLREIYENISTDETLRQLLSADYETARDAELALNRYNGFQDALASAPALTALKLYADPKLLKHDTPFSCYYPITEEVKAADWYTRASRTKGAFWASAMRIGQSGVEYWELNYYCHIPIPETSSYAILVMSVSNDYLRNLIRDKDYRVYASVNDGPVFFSSDRSYGGKAFPFALDSYSHAFSQTGTLTLFGEKTIGSIQSLKPSASSDYIYIAVSNPGAIGDIRYVQMIFSLVLTFALVISFLLIYFFSRYFSARIQTLRLAMHKASNNDYEIVNSIQGDDELSAAFQDLKAMVKKQKENDARIYEAQLKEQQLSNQQQQMELKLLATQINPHFLYNTLETIRMKAFSDGNREVATAIKLLGKSMRYVLGNTKSTATTLDKEIDYIKTYLAIQKMRFGERLNYTVEAAGELDLKSCRILPLLIQPIVENAISHGLEPTGRVGHIFLKLRQEEDLLIADVFDNGDGLTEEELQDVLMHLDTPRPESEHGVGLYNINSRVHLYYGSQYGLTIRSRYGEGTLVSLSIPLHN